MPPIMESIPYNRNGWIGPCSQVLWYLTVVKADQDDAGRFLIAGGLSFFMGIEDENNDVVIDGEAKYFVNGQPCGLSAGLRSTSYGLKVTVIK